MSPLAEGSLALNRFDDLFFESQWIVAEQFGNAHTKLPGRPDSEIFVYLHVYFTLTVEVQGEAKRTGAMIAE